MNYNLPTGIGLQVCHPNTLAIVKSAGKVPIDGGAGKIKNAIVKFLTKPGTWELNLIGKILKQTGLLLQTQYFISIPSYRFLMNSLLATGYLVLEKIEVMDLIK